MTGGGWMIVVFYLTAGIGPFALWGPVYRRHCEQDTGLVRAAGLGVGYSLFILIFYITSWRAFFRIVRRREDWFKTRRNAEFQSRTDQQGQPAAGGLRIITELMEENQ